jgi:phosphatidylserine/phosphatidylglycerophosphate/cardiolipin synthase-like enzyme
LSSGPPFARALLHALGRPDDAEAPTANHLAQAVVRALSGHGGDARVVAAFEAALNAEPVTDLVTVAVTGLDWLGSGVPALEQALLVAIGEASDELVLTSFNVTSGAVRVVQALEKALQRGVRVTIVINRLDTQERAGRSLLVELQQQFSHSFCLYDFVHPNELESLHAKLLIADRRVALVGSANLSFLGMIANHELGVLVRGPVAATIASCVDRLLYSPHVSRRR